MKATKRVFDPEVLQKARTSERHFFGIEPKSDLVVSFGRGKPWQIECKSNSSWSRLFEEATRESTWISTSQKKTEELLRAATSILISHHGGGKSLFGSLLMLQAPG